MMNDAKRHGTTKQAHRVAGKTSDLWEKILNTPIAWGLRAQGHIPTIQKMLGEGKSWQGIGAVIGWDAETAKLYYEREVAGTNAIGAPLAVAPSAQTGSSAPSAACPICTMPRDDEDGGCVRHSPEEIQAYLLAASKR